MRIRDRFKMRYDREHESLNKNLAEKRRDLDHKEYLISLREEKCKELEGATKKLKEDYDALEAKHKELLNNLQAQEKKLQATVEQLSIVAGTAKRDQEILASKESENKLLKEELQIIRKYLSLHHFIERMKKRNDRAKSAEANTRITRNQ